MPQSRRRRDSPLRVGLGRQSAGQVHLQRPAAPEQAADRGHAGPESGSSAYPSSLHPAKARLPGSPGGGEGGAGSESSTLLFQRAVRARERER